MLGKPMSVSGKKNGREVVRERDSYCSVGSRKENL